LKNDDDDLEDIFQSVRGIRERTPLREYPEGSELNSGLSGTHLDEKESETGHESQEYRPFRSKYSIFYPKMCRPASDENENTCTQTLSQDENKLGREENENEAKNEKIEQERKNDNMNEDAAEENKDNDEQKKKRDDNY